MKRLEMFLLAKGTPWVGWLDWMLQKLVKKVLELMGKTGDTQEDVQAGKGTFPTGNHQVFWKIMVLNIPKDHKNEFTMKNKDTEGTTKC